MSNSKKEFDWFDRPGVRRGLWVALWAVCAASVLAEVLLRRDPHHADHFKHFTGYYAVLGFVSCAVMIVVAKILGFALKVKPDYYERGKGGEDHA